MGNILHTGVKKKNKTIFLDGDKGFCIKKTESFPDNIPYEALKSELKSDLLFPQGTKVKATLSSSSIAAAQLIVLKSQGIRLLCFL